LSRRGHGDDGTGVISTLAGVTVFLVLLFFAVQVLTNLYATSVVTSVTYDAARRAATHGHPPTPDELADAEAHARSLLGRLGTKAAFDWSASDDDVVELRIEVPNPRFIPMVPLVGLDEVDRTVTVRIEEPR
jgi:Flp pilus assembly protein TadG